jgi:osmotically-inducible protein OsmY
MRKSICLPIFLMVVGLALATSQTSTPSSSASQVPAAKQSSPAGSEHPPSPAQTANTGSSAPDSSAASQSESETSTGDLQAQIQNALKNEPTLMHDRVNVSVSEEQIDVSGSVATAKEKLTAQRIVQSYAENRKVNDHVTVSGHKSGTSPAPNAGNPAASPDKTNSPSQPPR